MNELGRKFEKFSNSEFFEMTDERLVGEVGLSGIIPEAKFLHEADLFFQMYRVLFADLVLGDSIHLATHIILKKKSAMEAFELIEVEMGFMYDVLYTKLAKVRKSRVILRATTFLCLVSALMAFSLGMSKNNHGYLKAEITISYLLLYGAIAIEIYSVAVLSLTGLCFGLLGRGSHCSVLCIELFVLHDSCHFFGMTKDGNVEWHNTT
ncbi:hypothetical protein OIU74_030130 [Salix koriyanagi]|uniref:DUF4220 domain-containing protein n=1 Tax=Salix koriyanagi TaxID=2511006 RepID=A0A9Q0ZUW6_9ROSI|nr:hypothetical protein OIU74_030130 [Salix koriyanagi]